jgi:ABC-type transport system substrate-binding protein
MKKSFFSFSRLEKILLLICSVGLFFSFIGISWSFFEEHSEAKTSYGGAYSEGLVGTPSDMVLNPVFVHGTRDRSFEADITNLVFAGLMKFNAKTGKIEDYIGTHTLSHDKKTYVFRLKEGLLWHDGEPVTANDVVFTFRDIISNENFSNGSLRQAFESVKIQKISDLEVSFTLPYPYKFFLTNFTVGLLPRHILENVPVEEMEYHDFSQNPIGNGLYSFGELDEVRPNVFRISLNAFRSSSLGDPKLDTFEFVLYPSKNSLSLDSHRLMGVRPFPQYMKESLFVDPTLDSKSFALPQYSALFFNLDRDIFTGVDGKKIRTGLQLGTDKKTILETIVPGVRIDTPLLEMKEDDWMNEYAPEKANGSFKDAGYYFPSKKPKTLIPEKSSKEIILSPVTAPEWIEYSEKLVIKGVFPKNAESFKVFWNGEEKFSEERVENQDQWKWGIAVSDEVLKKRHEMRIKFFDTKEKFLAEDAISVYWEKGEKEGDVLKNQEPINNLQSEEGREEYIEDEKSEVTNNIDSVGEKDLSLENNSSEDFEEEKTLDSIQKSATTDGEISLEEIIQKGEIRETMEGEKLQLTLLTADRPPYYKEVAEYLKDDWRQVGVDLHIKVLPYQEFLDSVQHREYDILLHGQNLGYNLDIYEFFHGSQVGKSNLSNYKNEKASTLIQEIRISHSPEVREKKLQELRNILQRDIPAVFLFSPAYEYYFNPKIGGMDVKYIAFLRDRFSNADEWYLEKERTLKEDESWGSFPEWFSHKFISFITF